MPAVGSGLKLWWNQSQGQSGTTWSDLSGNGYDGTLTGSAVFSGGNVVVTGGGITMANPIPEQGTTDQEWTVEAWLCLPSGTTSTARYFIKYWNKGLYIPMGTTTKAILYNNSGTNDYYVYSKNAVTIGTTMVHWVFRFRNSDGTMKITTNNVDNTDTSPTNLTSTPFGIGNGGTLTVASAATMNIAVLRIYNRMLTDAEVSQNYAVGVTYTPISQSATVTAAVATATNTAKTVIPALTYAPLKATATATAPGATASTVPLVNVQAAKATATAGSPGGVLSYGSIKVAAVATASTTAKTASAMMSVAAAKGTATATGKPAIAKITVPPYILMICVYDKSATNFTNNGLAVLKDCTECFVEERLNDIYELSLTYPIDNKGKWKYLTKWNIIKADGQLYRIYKTEKELSQIKVHARHIFYDLLYNFNEDTRAVNANGAAALSTALACNSSYASTSDITTIDTAYFVKENPVKSIFEKIIPRWGGELVRDNYTVKLMQARGINRGTMVSYSKNVIGITETIDTDSVVTKIYPTGKDGLILSEKYITSPLDKTTNYPPFSIIREVQFEDCADQTSLRAAANAYIGTVDKPFVNYKIDFAELSRTVEYKDFAILEKMYMGDKVSVYVGKLNISILCEVVYQKKDLLKNRIVNVELGNSLGNIGQTLSKLETVSQTFGNAINDNGYFDASRLITTCNNGYVIYDSNGISIMDNIDKGQASKVWRWNLNGLGYSSTGYNGTFSLALTNNGQMSADFIKTGTMTANRISGGSLDFSTITCVNLTAADISTGTFTADRIQGGVLTLGGYNNQYGSMAIKDSSGNTFGNIDCTGISFNLNNNSLSLTTTQMQLYNFSNGSSLTLKQTGLSSNYNSTFCLSIGKATSSWITSPSSNGTEFDYNTDLYFINMIYGSSSLIRFTGGGSATLNGTLTASSKSAFTNTENYGEVVTYCDESPNHVFVDRGRGILDEVGECYVFIDPIFLETVNTQSADYWVLLTGFKGASVEIKELQPTYFVATGTPNKEFMWKIEAERLGYERLRFNEAMIG